MKLYIDCQFETVLACPLCIVALRLSKELSEEVLREGNSKIRKSELVEAVDEEIKRGAIIYEEDYIYPNLINQLGLLKAIKIKVEFLSAKYSYKNKNLEVILCRDKLPKSNFYKTSVETNSLEAHITKLISSTRREWLLKTVYSDYYKEYNWQSNFALATEDHCLRVIKYGINHLFILENLRLVGLSWNKAYKKLKPETIVSDVYAGSPPKWWYEFLSEEPFGVINNQVTGCTNIKFINWLCRLSKPTYDVKYLFED
jgi:hypothetical protein